MVSLLFGKGLWIESLGHRAHVHRVPFSLHYLMCVDSWHGTHVGARGQVMGVASLLIMWVLGIELRMSGLAANALSC